MQELVEKLNHYTKLYDEGNPVISDNRKNITSANPHDKSIYITLLILL